MLLLLFAKVSDIVYLRLVVLDLILTRGLRLKFKTCIAVVKFAAYIKVAAVARNVYAVVHILSRDRKVNIRRSFV